MKHAICVVLLASVVSLQGFDNLDFEQIPPPTNSWTDNVPGWLHIGANGHGGNWWNVNSFNLSGWAEPFVVQFEDPPPPELPWPASPIDGQFSIGFFSAWAAGTTTADFFGPSYPDYGFNGDEDIGRAWISQTGTIGMDEPRLTLLTDYEGPNYTGPEGEVVGYLSIYFEGMPVMFALEDTVFMGQPMKRLVGDLSSFVGQTGELRIGIEGPHQFVIDDIELIPEPTSLALLVLGAAGLCAWRRPRPGRCNVPLIAATRHSNPT